MAPPPLEARQGDKETGRQGEGEGKSSPCLPVSLSPCLASPPPLRALTAFRFFAALAVCLHHLAGSFGPVDRGVPRFLHEGFSGVTFFFVLSGFILAYNYRSTFTTLRGRELRRFYAARFARIYPVHLLAILVVLPVFWAPNRYLPAGEPVWRVVSQLTLTHSFIPRPQYYFAYNAPGWSLSDEWFFYAVLPLLLWALAGLRLRGPVACGLLAVGVWGAALTTVASYHGHPRGHWLFYVNPLFRLSDFLVGVLLCLLLTREGPKRDKGTRRQGDKEKEALAGASGSSAASSDRSLSPCLLVPLSRFFPWATALEVASLGLLAAAVYFAPRVPLTVRLGAYYTPFIAAVVAAFALQRGLISRLCGSRPLQFLGEVSFGFYMFHLTALLYLEQYRGALGLTHCGPRTSAALVIGTTLLVSSLCFLFYERPLRDWLRRKLSGSTPRRAPAAAELPERRAA